MDGHTKAGVYRNLPKAPIQALPQVGRRLRLHYFRGSNNGASQLRNDF